MNKKISILTIVFTGVMGFGALAAEGTPINLGKEMSESLTTQEFINRARNIELPGTDMKSAIGPSVSASTAGSTLDKDGSWNVSLMGEDLLYKAKTDDDPNEKGNRGWIRTEKNNKYFLSCALPEDPKNLRKIGEAIRCLFTNLKGDNEHCKHLNLPYGVRCNEAGFVEIPSDKMAIIINKDGEASSNKNGVANTDGLFYKYWITVNTADYMGCDTDPSTFKNKVSNAVTDGTVAQKYPCECQYGLLGGCWSPSYPIIAYSGFNRTKFNKRVTESKSASEFDKLRDGLKVMVANDFGERTQYFNRLNTANISEVMNTRKNQYINNPEDPLYRMEVQVKPHIESGVDTGTIHNSSTGYNGAILTVQKWSKVGNDGLDPNFNYEALDPTSSSADGATETKSLNKFDNLNLVSDVMDEYNSILPCGMFTNDKDIKPEGVYDLSGTKCVNNTYIREERDYVTGDPLYTYYHVKLPVGTNKEGTVFETINDADTHRFNVRACARCVNANSKDMCKKLVVDIIRSDSDPTPEKVVRKIREKLGTTGANAKGYSIHTNSGKDNFSDEYVYATYTGTMTCETCLNYLDDLFEDAEIKKLLGVNN